MNQQEERMDEKELYKRKATLLRRALATADKMDAEDANLTKTRPVFELGSGQGLAGNQYDGMEDLLGDDILPTDWNPDIEGPPHEAWFNHVEGQEAAWAQEGAGEAGINRRPVYELEPGHELAAGEYDGMEDMLCDDTLETDWDIADGGVPPPGFWQGTHTRHGERRPGFTEVEYLDGETWKVEKVSEEGGKP
jgi:hypothetical protein